MSAKPKKSHDKQTSGGIHRIHVTRSIVLLQRRVTLMRLTSVGVLDCPSKRCRRLPVATMVIYEEGSFVNSRSQKLYTLSYAPDDPSSIQGVLFWMHGFGEYCGRYKEVFTRLAEEAHVVIYSYDMHGHGKSEPTDEKGRTYLNHFEELVDDALQYLDLCLPKHQGLPWLSCGHSLGGLLAVYMVLKRSKVFSGLVLGSALIDVEWTPFLRFQASIGDCLAGCIPMAKIVPAVRPEDMNPTPELIKQYKEDPLIYQGNLKANTANEIRKAFQSCVDKHSQIAVPIYAFHGTMDKTTSLPAVKRLVAAATSSDKTLDEVKGGYHEVLFGPLKDQVITSLVAWVKAHTVGPTAFN